LIAALLGLFMIVPLVTLLATGSWRRTWEAIKGYSVVLALVMGIPMAIGAVMAMVSLID
jgi:hypothetical protein